MTQKSVKREVDNRKAGAGELVTVTYFIFHVLRLHTIQARPARTGGLGAEPPALCVLVCTRFQLFH